MGSPIHIWNIADTSRIHASNLLINGLDPETACLGDQCTAGANCTKLIMVQAASGGMVFLLDYFGARWYEEATYGALGNQFANCGIFRLMLSPQGEI